MSIYVGAAKCKVDLRQAIGRNMQGFGVTQEAKSLGMDFYSRAFTIADDHHHVAIAVVDLWACTESIKKEAVARINAKTPGGVSFFKAENVQIVGTHTHSGPAGVSEYRLYNFTSGGFNESIRNAYADAIAQSIVDAFKSQGAGEIRLHRTNINDCGRNRSTPAYLNNPEAERKRYSKDTDDEMIVLEFVQKYLNRRIGILSWYPIHCTDIGQTNTVLHGDNKGFASQILEKEVGSIVAFANANAGDVSGNVGLGLPTADTARALKHGQQQADAVRAALGSFRTGMPAQVDCQYAVVDMSNVRIAGTSNRTYVPTLGLSMFAGSPADSTPPFPASELSVGIVRGQVSLKQAMIQALLLCGGSEKDINLELLRYIAANNPTLGAVLAVRGFNLVIAPFLFLAGGILEIVQRAAGGINARSFFSLTEEEKAGHDPKPITMVADKLVPSELPLQLMRIGDLVIAGVPGEMTTMAGRRLKAELKERYDAVRPKRGNFTNPVEAVVVSGYANAYSQYITTPEEYKMQHYEGASTLFGPHTLDAYIQEFCKLVPAGS